MNNIIVQVVVYFSQHSMPNIAQESSLSKEQKTGFVLLLFFAIATVVLGFFQLHNTLYEPFAIQEAKRAPAVIDSTVLADDAEKLKALDTDHDGLTDYDEINSFHTSPYLPDTDSDGKTDKQEIDSNADPLCPEGQNCAAADLPTSASTNEVANELNIQAGNSVTPLSIIGGAGIQPVDPSALAAPAQPVSVETDIQAVLRDPAKLRSYLAATGKITSEQLAKIDDATLLKTFQSSYEEQMKNAPVNQSDTSLSTSTK